MATNFVPVELENVEQGRFQELCEKEFRKLQIAVIKHVGEMVDPQTEKAVGVLNMKVSIQYADVGYKLVTDIENKPPKKRLVGVSTALPEQDEDGTMRLFSQTSGTNKGNPRQGVLTTDDGKKSDQETGEVFIG